MKKYLLEKEKAPMLLGIELEAQVRNQDNRDYEVEEIQNILSPLLEAQDFPCEDFGQDGGGIEIAFSPASFKWLKANKKIFESVLNVLKKKECVENSNIAGIHIHFDRKVFTKDNFYDFVKFLKENKDFTLKFSNRRSRTSYINPETNQGKDQYQFKESNKEEWLEMFNQKDWSSGFEKIGDDSEFGDDYNYDEHVGNNCITLNSNGDGTVECRFFNSTLDINRFMANISFIHALVFFIKSDRKKTLEQFIDFCSKYATRYKDFVEFFLIPNNYLPKTVLDTTFKKKKVARKSNVRFN